MNAKAWIASFSRELGVEPPTPEQFGAILDLAAEAAHASERVAAPVACWVSARAGRSLEESLALARRIGAGAPQTDPEAPRT
ncbi:MAG TPA: DUF6457 domain-containing protein [Solirubrobacteraceae bacterium]|jgi:Domain of unknown function (DUF6457)|nr:DUF6457 domain-containing protein [Solirubrobacteraceae bacterium]